MDESVGPPPASPRSLLGLLARPERSVRGDGCRTTGIIEHDGRVRATSMLGWRLNWELPSSDRCSKCPPSHLRRQRRIEARMAMGTGMADRPTLRLRWGWSRPLRWVQGNRPVNRMVTIRERGETAMSDIHWTDLPSIEQAETAAAGDSAASLAKGAIFTNDVTTDDPAGVSTGDPPGTPDSVVAVQD